MVSENDLLFSQTREQSPQWSVSIGGKEIAVVTQRYISLFPYIVIVSGENDATFHTRDEVIDYILDGLNGR